ncbi:MoxR family ATPase [Psychrobacter sp. HD31]|uniref:AAA family ATPase n=1 Tax=Psychrobacter sp. HD31 TaxID=3112003 RepID=UPI003DA5415F
MTQTNNTQFTGTQNYIATEDLQLAVNASITLQKPLLIKGEPGTGKTLLAEEIAKSLDMPLITWHIKSTTKAEQGLYEYDAVSRLRDSQLGEDRVYDINNYIKPGKLWEAFTSEQRSVLLIDEVDKADIEFPNDLLHELDKMSFYVYETGETVTAQQRPVVIITSNNEKELPDAFLRRCFFHYIDFPDEHTMRQIIDVHFPNIKEKLINEALTLFFKLRELQGLKKPPSTSELVDWLTLLMADDNAQQKLEDTLSGNTGELPLAGALLKNEADMELLARFNNLLRG